MTVVRRGKSNTLTNVQRTWLRRRQAIEPSIGHLKADHRMDRCWLKGSEGDVRHAVLCAAGFNIRWLLRAIAARGLKASSLALSLLLALRQLTVLLRIAAVDGVSTISTASHSAAVGAGLKPILQVCPRKLDPSAGAVVDWSAQVAQAMRGLRWHREPGQATARKLRPCARPRR
jgi:hypothetical protein